MQLVIELDSNFDKTIAELGSMGGRIGAAAGRGLLAAGQLAANNVVKNYLTGQALKRRSGDLARAVQSWGESPDDVVVGVRPGSAVAKYKWLLGDEQMTITPNRGHFLAIPAGENLTPTGRTRYESPRDKPEGFFVRTGSQLLFGYRRGKTKRAKFRLLFVLVPSVFVQGTGALADGVLDVEDNMTDLVQARIEGVN